MGYCTYFSLDVENATIEQREQINDWLRNHNIIGYALDVAWEPYDMVKWYDEEKDMKALSALFPSVHFILSGDGEDSGDIWVKHYVGGKVQRCYADIVIPEYDPTKLGE